MRDRAPNEIAQLEAAIGGAGVPDRLAARADVSGLRAIGFDESLVADVVEAVLPRPELRNTPRPPDEAQLRAFVERAL
jgi:alcohol dehydrogenase class IV